MTLAILIFETFDGDRITIRQPTKEATDYVVKFYPNAILKFYDFQTFEIITLVNEEFSWVSFAYEVNENLCSFMNTNKTKIKTSESVSLAV